MKHLIDDTMVSNLYTMGVAAVYDKRQAVPDKPSMPNAEVRVLRAKLIMEEAWETVKALGVVIQSTADDLIDTSAEISFNDLGFYASDDNPRCDFFEPNMEEAIDGCCDLIYVAVGTLAAMGVPNKKHQDAVNRSNNAKFPGGKATFNASGKFQKPEGWKPPDHYQAMLDYTNPDGILDSKGVEYEVHETGIKMPSLKDLQRQILEQPEKWL